MTGCAFTLQWHLTEACNLRCAHCYQDGRGGEVRLDQVAVVAGQLVELLDRLGLSRGRLTLTGGEPLARPDFFDAVHALGLFRSRVDLAVLTNGTLIDRDAARRLAAARPAYVQVSLDGSGPTHDAIRGAGSHARAVAGLERLVEAGVWTVVSFTAHRGNFRDFPEVARLGRSLGVRRVWADRLVPEGRGASLECLDQAETRELFALMRRARPRRRGPTEMAMHRALQFLEAGGEPYRCHAARQLLALLPDGTVLPCRRMPIPVGNVFQTPLAQVWADAPLLRALRSDRVPERCRGCLWTQACGGGLRCLGHALTGDPFQTDPGCWLPGQPRTRVPFAGPIEEERA